MTGMDLAGMVKTLVLPAGFRPPRRLTYRDVTAWVLSRDDLDDDVTGVNTSVDLIARTRGGGWPAGTVTVDDDYVDLVWHEHEFRERYSFAYAVRHVDGGYLGCVYLYPMGRRVALTEDLLHHDVDASWWVTTEAYGRGYYETVFDAVRHWVTTEFPFRDPFFSNREVPGGGATVPR